MRCQEAAVGGVDDPRFRSQSRGGERDAQALAAMRRSRLARLESAKAIKATALELARIVRATLKAGQIYVEKGIAAFEEQNRKRKTASSECMAASLNLELVPPTTDGSVEFAARP